jgi:histidyl-tRNA synthetase
MIWAFLLNKKYTIKMEIKTSKTYKGTRIVFGETARNKRRLLNQMIEIMESYGYQEMMIPVIQLTETFASKVGEENNNMMYTFTDRGNRDICLAPEYTAIVQQLANETFKMTKNVKLFYIGECFRGEKPQAGRYRQFTQFGVEVINPTEDMTDEMLEISTKLIELATDNYEVNLDATRGLDYYTGGKGFEISCPELGAQKQICGGGSYEGGVGFALGIDRLILTTK